jgi:hypothetical protein
MRLPSLPFLSRTPPATIFVPAERFFVRVVPLAPDAEPEAQVEIALEGLAPFPLPQLFWGFVVAPDRGSALVYAAHRRRFSAEEIKSWQQAALVVPAFLALAGRPANVPAVLVHTGGPQLAGAAWRHAADQLPSLVMVRGYPAEPTPEERQAFAKDLASRAGLGTTAPRFVAGEPGVASGRDGLQFRLGGIDATLRRDQLDFLDVRDREFLAERRRLLRRGTLLWRAMLAGAVTALVAAAVESAALALHMRAAGLQAVIAAQTPTVQRLETAHTLATRVDELARQRLRPFEMLVVLNEKRPASVQFVRTTTQGSNTVEVEAQTANAGDVSNFEQALHDAAGVATVKTRDIRARDGVTSFVITVVFQPDTLQTSTKGPA